MRHAQHGREPHQFSRGLSFADCGGARCVDPPYGFSPSARRGGKVRVNMLRAPAVRAATPGPWPLTSGPCFCGPPGPRSLASGPFSCGPGALVPGPRPQAPLLRSLVPVLDLAASDCRYSGCGGSISSRRNERGGRGGRFALRWLRLKTEALKTEKPGSAFANLRRPWGFEESCNRSRVGSLENKGLLNRGRAKGAKKCDGGNAGPKLVH